MARRSVGLLGLAGLAVATVPLAAPGTGLVPAAADGGPGWLMGIYGGGLGLSPGAYYCFLWLAFASHLCVFLAAPALDRRLLRGAAIVLLGAFALAPPLLSQDVFSYIEYARMGVLHGLDPYTHLPAEAVADPAFAHVGWPDSTSAYGPLFTLATYPLAWVSVPVALWTLKGVAASSVLALAWLVARLAPARGVDPKRGFTMVALNPLVLIHVVGGAHNDATTMLVAMLGVAAVLAARQAAGGFALVSAVAMKVSAAFVLPFALLGAARHPQRCNAKGAYGPTFTLHLGAGRFLAAGAAALAAIGALAWLAFGWSWLDSFALAGENQARVSNYSLPNLISEATSIGVDTVRVAALAAYLALLGGLLLWVHRGADWIRAAGWAALGLLLASAWLLPWYIVWALPFAALSRDYRLISATLALTALQLAARVPL